MDISLAYNPLPKQRDFHQSEAKYKAYVGGFGSGKTKAGCCEVIELSMRYKNNLGLICRKTYLELKDTTMRTFFDECPPALIKEHNKSEHMVTFWNGSQVLFRSLDNSEKFKSLELGFFYIDEASEIDERCFRILSGRLRKQGVPRRVGFITSNPPYTDHWIYRLFVEEPTDDFDFIHAPSTENPFLPDGYIDELRRNYPPEWVRVFLDGEFGFIADGKPVYADFKPHIHVKDTSYVPGIPVSRGWDFGYHSPAVVFSQKLGDRLIVLGELEGKEETIDKFAKKVIGVSCQRFGKDATYVDYCDPAGRQKNDKSEKTSVQILQSLGVYPQSKVQSINDGVLIIRILLQKHDDGLPGLVIDRAARKLIQGFSGGYHYPEGDQPDNQKTPKKDNIFDHLQDALRYIVGNQQDFRSWLVVPTVENINGGNFDFWRKLNKKKGRGYASSHIPTFKI